MSTSSAEISSQYFRHKNGYFATRTAKNYCTWCESMKNVLQGKGFWLIIEEEEHRPPNAPRGSDDALVVSRTAAQQAFDVKYRECVLMLKSACSPTIRPYISRLDCPIQIWETLERKLGGSNTVHARLALVMKFNSLKPQDGERLEEYFAKLINIRNQLHDSPAAIVDAQFTSQILQSMPSYLSVTVQFCFQEPEMTPDEVMDHICKTAGGIRKVQAPAAEAEALAMESRRSSGSRKWFSYCKDKRHWTSECSKKSQDGKIQTSGHGKRK
jgi:hypothetical protein